MGTLAPKKQMHHGRERKGNNNTLNDVGGDS